MQMKYSDTKRLSKQWMPEIKFRHQKNEHKSQSNQTIFLFF